MVEEPSLTLHVLLVAFPHVQVVHLYSTPSAKITLALLVHISQYTSERGQNQPSLKALSKIAKSKGMNMCHREQKRIPVARMTRLTNLSINGPCIRRECLTTVQFLLLSSRLIARLKTENISSVDYARSF